MKRKDRYRLWTAAVVLYAVVLPVSGLMGIAQNGRNNRMQKEAVREPKVVNEQSTLKENEENSQTDEQEKSGLGENPAVSETVSGELSLTAEQLDAAEEVFSALESLDMEQAARIMDREQAVLADLFYETMDGTRYLYTPSGFTAQIEGEGMVFTMPGTVFYGYFKDGKPRGECLALQFINVDSPRYNYSYGIWRDGRMTGYGSTGYCYYETVPQGETAKTVKQGNFENDLLEGEISYETTSADGTVSHWYMAVSKGMTVIDIRWTWLEEEKEYQLMSADAQSHGYLISREQAGQVMWMNLLGWGI